MEKKDAVAVVVDTTEPEAEPLTKPEVKKTKKGKMKGGGVMTTAEYTAWMREDAERKAEEDRIDKESQEQFFGYIRTIYNSLPFKILYWVYFILMNILPFISIVIGIMYFGEEHCPADHVAIIMIITGVFGSITSTVYLYSLWVNRNEPKVPSAPPLLPQTEISNGTTATEAANSQQGQGAEIQQLQVEEATQVAKKGITISMSVIWFALIYICIFIYACVIVFRLYGSVQYEKVEEGAEETNEYYCDKVLYRFAFWTLASSFIIIGVMISSMCCWCSIFIGFMCWKTRRAGQEED